MNRRTLLKFFSWLLGLASAAVVAIPGVVFSLDALTRRMSKKKEEDGGSLWRPTRLSELKPGVPHMALLMGSRKDAWILYPEQVLGRVWFLRKSDESAPPEKTEVVAFSAVCPHLGCTVELGPEKDNFFCACHKGWFHLDGEAWTSKELGYPSPLPRGMDPLECKVVKDEEADEWWVEVKYEQFKQNIPDRVPIG